MRKRMAVILAAMVLALFSIAGTAQAATYGFEVLNDYYKDYDASTASLATAAAAATAPFLGLEVTGSGNTVNFRFTNDVLFGDSAVVTAIYWDFGSYSGSFSATPTLTQSSGVSFVQKTGKLNLPEGGTIGFDAMFGVADDGSQGAGINGGEWLTVSWLLGSGLDFNGLVSAINSGQIRVGMHVQSLSDPNASSMSVVTRTPVPGAVWLLGTGLVGLIGLRRKSQG